MECIPVAGTAVTQGDCIYSVLRSAVYAFKSEF